MGKTKEWLALGSQLLDACDRLLREAKVDGKGQDETNQCTVALALLCRTVNNYAGARVLIEQAFIVEARTLVRSCYENLFWIASLAADGPKFIPSMMMSDATNRIKRGKALLEWAKETGGKDFEGTLDAFVQNLEAETLKKGDVNLFEAARAGNVKAAYIIYRVLSTDAAHPSATSLDRHLQYDDWENPTRLTFSGVPKVDEGETDQTAEFAFSSLLTVALFANKIVGQTDAGNDLADLYEEFQKLSGRKPRA